ncbi:MAG: molybdopterin-dependent oxidoreductase [Sterolibacterium sp.]|jgi:cytochrome c551/c552|nr:molybdopterin-dependent oxidoreductase [Sterolibacterium sp.]
MNFKSMQHCVPMWLVVSTGFVLGSASVAAHEVAVLAQKSGCLACHKGAGKGNGPAYKDVAAKYAGNKNAVAILSKHIRQGTGPNGVGWMDAGKASLPFMPVNHVSQAQAQQLANWVLTIQEEIPDINRLFVTEQITVTGKVEKPLRLDPAALRKLPLQQVGEVPLVCQSGADKGKLENFKGVRLTDILDQAKILAPGHNDVKKLAIIATASDGYKAVFSWNELYNSPIGEGVMVFFEKNGQPLSDDEGRIALVSSKDSRTGPRHVKWLQAIEVRRVAD